MGIAVPPHLERVAIKSFCQTRDELISGSCLCNEGQGGHRARLVSAGDLEAIRVAGLVCKGFRGSGVVAGRLQLCLTGNGLPKGSGAREHGSVRPSAGVELQWGEVNGCAVRMGS